MDIFCDPQIFAESDDYLYRRLTYTNDDFQTGASYTFEQGKIAQVTIGEIKWRSLNTSMARCIVDGVNLCPGEQCPFDGAVLKPEWQGKSLREMVERLQ